MVENVKELAAAFVRTGTWKSARRYLLLWREQISKQKLSHFSRFNSYEKKVTSQNGEDGLLLELFSRIPNNRFAVEIGVEDGRECNTALLIQQYNWSGLMVEADESFFKPLVNNYAKLANVRCVCARVDRENIVSLLAGENVPFDIDLLSIDIDGNDYWIWEALSAFSPKVVVIEYNSTLGPCDRKAIGYDPNHHWIGDCYFGASIAAYTALADRKGYALIGTDNAGVNAFFVRRDLLLACGFPEKTPREAFKKNRLGTLLFPNGKANFVNV